MNFLTIESARIAGQPMLVPTLAVSWIHSIVSFAICHLGAVSVAHSFIYIPIQTGVAYTLRHRVFDSADCSSNVATIHLALLGKVIPVLISLAAALSQLLVR